MVSEPDGKAAYDAGRARAVLMEVGERSGWSRRALKNATGEHQVQGREGLRWA